MPGAGGLLSTASLSPSGQRGRFWYNTRARRFRAPHGYDVLGRSESAEDVSASYPGHGMICASESLPGILPSPTTYREDART